MRAAVLLGLATAFVTAACGDDGAPAPTAYFDLTGSLDTSVSDGSVFWNTPWPSDLRLAPSGGPDITGYPNPRHIPILNSLLDTVSVRKGWPVMSIAYFRFTAPIPDRAITDVIAPADDAPILLLDVDPASPERGTRFPIVARTLPKDTYVPEDLLAVAPRPGIVLRANTRYAYVVRTAFAPGFSPAPGIRDLAAGKTPSGAWGAAAAALFAPLWDTLDQQGLARTDVIVATVFTTGDEVARAHARSEAIRAAYHPTIDNLALVGGNTYDGFCHLAGTITMPQFQHGTPPWDTDGHFVLDGNDVPMKQADMTIPLQITIPKTAMPASGWPLYQFFHGSGGLSTGLVDLGHSPDSGDHPEAGKGPGYVVAHHGLAAVSAALPLNPERYVGATDYQYLNISNLSAFPPTFQQGMYEQRLLTDAMIALQIPDSVLAGCGNVAPPGGKHVFDAAKLVAGGQSMGGMYTNLIGAIEPRFGALVPTGAGGFWNLMILQTAIIPGALDLLSTALSVDPLELTFVHPGLNAMAMGWEIAEPLAYMARLGRRPLDTFPIRHVYEPVGKGDTYFPTDVYDAAALAYGNQEAVNPVWPSMQGVLALDKLDTLAGYNVHGNRDGKTRVVVQFEGDGLIDAHYIYRQLDSVKHQYGCFLESYLRDGVPTVPSPTGALFDPCPSN